MATKRLKKNCQTALLQKLSREHDRLDGELGELENLISRYDDEARPDEEVVAYVKELARTYEKEVRKIDKSLSVSIFVALAKQFVAEAKEINHKVTERVRSFNGQLKDLRAQVRKAEVALRKEQERIEHEKAWISESRRS